MRLELGRGRWIEVKKELSYIDERRMVSAGITSMRTGAPAQSDEEPERGTEVRLQVGQMELVKLHIWLVDWNATDEFDKKIFCEAASINGLKPAVAHLMVEAIDRYQDEQAARKNRPRLATKS